MNKLKILSDKYSQTMKILILELCYMSAEELNTCFYCISRFDNLMELSLNVKIDYLTEEEMKTCIECIDRFENLRELTLGFILVA